MASSFSRPPRISSKGGLRPSPSAPRSQRRPGPEELCPGPGSPAALGRSRTTEVRRPVVPHEDHLILLFQTRMLALRVDDSEGDLALAELLTNDAHRVALPAS